MNSPPDTHQISKETTSKTILYHVLGKWCVKTLDQWQQRSDNDGPKNPDKLHIDNQSDKAKESSDELIAGFLSRRPDISVRPLWNVCRLINAIFNRYNDCDNIGQLVSDCHRHVENRNENGSQDKVPEGMKRRKELFDRPITPYCRRHRELACAQCQTRENVPVQGHAPLSFTESAHMDPNQEPISPPSPDARPTSLPPRPHRPGLADSIPAFLGISAELLRCELDKSGDRAEPLVFNGEKVMGGGMPAQWYDLFICILTQAAIECYLCDGMTGEEQIVELFSYGHVEDEDAEEEEGEEGEEEGEESDVENEDAEDAEDEDGEEEEEDNNGWDVTKADQSLLFPKTRTMHLFATQLHEREREVLDVKDDLEKHFVQLARTYPLDLFERKVFDFLQHFLDRTQILSKSEPNLSTLNGTILIPEDEKPSTHEPRGVKRRASFSESE